MHGSGGVVDETTICFHKPMNLENETCSVRPL